MSCFKFCEIMKSVSMTREVEFQNAANYSCNFLRKTTEFPDVIYYTILYCAKGQFYEYLVFSEQSNRNHFPKI